MRPRSSVEESAALSRFSVIAASILCGLAWITSAEAQDAKSGPTAVVNGEAITAEALEARQYDLIGKEAIVAPVLDESRQLSRTPAVKQDLKGLMAAVVQENPEASKEQIMALVQEKSVAYTQTLAVRRVKPKLFADVEAKALDALIDEQLMLQDAKSQNVTIDDKEVEMAANAEPKRAGAETEDLHKLLVAWDKRALPGAKARIRAAMAWKAALKARLGSAPDEATAAKELAALRQSAKIEKP